MLYVQGLAGMDVDFEQTWPLIQTAFREIHTRNASALSYEELYRNCYRVVLKKRGEDLYGHVRNFEHEWLSTDVRPDIVASISPQLWSEQTVGGASNNELRTAGERFLKALRGAYSHHEVCMAMIADTLMYMVRSFSFLAIDGEQRRGQSIFFNSNGYSPDPLTVTHRTASTARTAKFRPSIRPPWVSSATISS